MARGNPLRKSLSTVLLCFSTLVASGQISAQEGSAWQAAVIAGFNSVAAAKDSLLADNRGAELGLYVTTPWRLWNEHYTALSLRAQAVAYPNAIVTPSPAVAGENVKLTNAVHSQLRADIRQIYELWDIHWTLGLGFLLPVSSSISTPRGEFTYTEARTVYPESAGNLRKIDRSYAVFLRVGIDQKLMNDMLLLGLGLDISALEFPRTEQLVSFNFYAGVRVW
ncbi:MAG: hypothetical protein ACOY5B_15435 [Spirochaetota bacterium]